MLNIRKLTREECIDARKEFRKLLKVINLKEASFIAIDRKDYPLLCVAMDVIYIGHIPSIREMLETAYPDEEHISGEIRDALVSNGWELE